VLGFSAEIPLFEMIFKVMSRGLFDVVSILLLTGRVLFSLCLAKVV
jgi:hypothetical protein